MTINFKLSDVPAVDAAELGAAMRMLIEAGIARGEIRQKELKDFPQIVVAPAIVAIVWKSLFERHSPLDARAMLRVHLDLIFGERSKP